LGTPKCGEGFGWLILPLSIHNGSVGTHLAKEKTNKNRNSMGIYLLTKQLIIITFLDERLQYQIIFQVLDSALLYVIHQIKNNVLLGKGYNE
jgi:hypothetical protein